MTDKKGVLIKILVVIIIVLVAVMIYAFVVRPGISGYAINRQNEGFEIAIVSIMQRAITCQPVPLTYGNQTVNLIAIECLQQPPQ